MQKKLMIVLMGLMVFTLGVEAQNVNVFDSVRKFGMTATAKMFGESGSEILVQGESKVRYRDWWVARSWENGYAKMNVTKGGKAYKAKNLYIEQGDVVRGSGYIVHRKHLSVNNASSINMSLSEYKGNVACAFRVTAQNGFQLIRYTYNDWIND
ncbi:MAG: hypothetical protein KU29_08850 [Sulfurovum sp. FS06-10]|jgi:hypothetical protein|nr:MAG: hypothetical protein KU29_08850 [Sulfurovum sp. FS06-10]